MRSSKTGHKTSSVGSAVWHVAPSCCNQMLPICSSSIFVHNIWFQQNRTTCHTAEPTLDVLHPVFEDRINSRRTDVFWPPRSCDLTPLDYYLWDAVKGKCYVDKPEAIDALKDNIREAIGGIQLDTIDNVNKNMTDRVGYCMASRGSYLNEIIFNY